MFPATTGTADSLAKYMLLNGQTQTNSFEFPALKASHGDGLLIQLGSELVDTLEDINFLFFSQRTRGADFQIFFTEREKNAIHIDNEIASAISSSIFEMLEP